MVILYREGAYYLDLMVTPKPIFDTANDVMGYRLSFQIGNAIIEGAKTLSIDSLYVHSPFLDFVNKIGLQALTMNKLVFLPVTDIQMATDFETGCDVDYSLLALTLNENNIATEKNLERIKRYRALGFKIAIFNYQSIQSIAAFFPYIDYLFCESKAADLTTALKHIILNNLPVKLIAKHVESEKTHAQASAVGIKFFEGSFYKLPTCSTNKKISPLQVNYMRLLNQVNRDDFDIGKFSAVVQRDPALAIRFLQMVNSSFGRGGKINSMRHAAAMIGQKEIKRWITTAVASSLSQEGPTELTRISLLRAQFCENVSGLFEMAAHKENLFLMGLFSVLDAILDTTIDQALEMVIVPDQVHEALLGKDGEFGEIYRFIKLYEQGDWMEISRIALMKNLSISDIFQTYYDALEWYGNMINIAIDKDDLGTI